MSESSGDEPICTDCGGFLTREIQDHRNNQTRYRWRCGRCKRWRNLHGLAPDDVEALHQIQNHKCAICHQTTDLVIDHDHACCPSKRSCADCRRGLLCSPCNRMIGLAKDDALILLQASGYLLRYQRFGTGSG